MRHFFLRAIVVFANTRLSGSPFSKSLAGFADSSCSNGLLKDLTCISSCCKLVLRSEDDPLSCGLVVESVVLLSLGVFSASSFIKCCDDRRAF